MKELVAALRFLTILPIPGSFGTGERELTRSVPFFPVVGLVIGGTSGGLVWLVGGSVPPALLAVGAVILLLAFSGALHLDGLSDTADGFLSARRRERILEIMKDSHVGAMGAVAIVCLLGAKWAALESLTAAPLAWTVFLMPVLGRGALVLHMAVLPYARPEGGLATVFYQSRPRLGAVWSLLVMCGAGWLAFRVPGLLAAAAATAVALIFSAYCYRKIGGATGDTLGATCELAEAAGAVVVAVWMYRSL